MDHLGHIGAALAAASLVAVALGAVATGQGPAPRAPRLSFGVLLHRGLTGPGPLI